MVPGEHDLQHRRQDPGRHAQGHLAEDRLSSRPLLAVLAGRGLAPRPAAPADTSVEAAYLVPVGRTEITFRCLDPTTVLLVRVRRLEAAPGLASPLQGIARFVALLAATRGETGLAHVVGVVNTELFRDMNGLDDDRLGAFYQRLHGARTLTAEDLPTLPDLDRQLVDKPGGKRWVGLELARFRGERPRRVQEGTSIAPEHDPG